MNKIKEKRRELRYEMMVIFIFLNSLGFPGNYTLIFGDWLGTLVDYGCFFMELYLMLWAGSDGVLDLKMITFKQKYTVIYLFWAFLVADSMAMTTLPKEEAITMVRLSVTMFFALWLCDYFSADRIVGMLFLAHSVFMVATILFTILFPGRTIRSYASGVDFIGLFDSKNNCATEISFGLAVTALNGRIRRKQGKRYGKLEYLVLAIQLYFLVRCASVGAWIVAAVSVSYILFFQRRVRALKRIPIGWMFVAGSVLFLVAAVTILPIFSPLFELVGKDATLTGRVPLWNRAIQVMSQNRPLTGYGYGMFWRNESAVSLIQQGFARDSFMGNLTTGSHNLLIEMWMSLGLIGLFLFFFTILRCFRKCGEIEENAYLFCCTFFLVFTVKGLSERLLSSAYTYDVMLFFLTLAMGCGKRTNIRPAWKRLHCQEFPREEGAT